MALVPISSHSPSTNSHSVDGGRFSRRTAFALDRLEHATYVRLAEVQANEALRMARIEADAVVATVKAQEIDRLAREAISGQAMLRRFSDTLAQGDLMLADELRFFTDMARLGKGEIIADLTTDFCRESRRAGR